MKRYTERDAYGNADIIELSDIMPDIYGGLPFDKANALTAALNRIAAYEDTGLTPAEIERLKSENARLNNLLDDIELMIQSAESEGRT